MSSRQLELSQPDSFSTPPRRAVPLLASGAVLLLLLVAAQWFNPWQPSSDSVDCTLAQQGCRFMVDGWEIWVRVNADPIRASQPFDLLVTGGNADLSPTGVAITGVNMYMGITRFPFQSTGTGFVATATLPLCTERRMEWLAQIELATPAGSRALQMRFHSN